ncbi:hypothetical protein AAP_00002 [Ascosphaera apis ARSEF 7405]|uniref:Uncharacterized protein n=1 Tax=Ascosphaera apis ARSEF 7405 TaxID=392613 RepID=A0A168DH47_9EURO|nr:hypothetical protein AAP_00002 [Ascosphaera apis ARSEF 7405]
MPASQTVPCSGQAELFIQVQPTELKPMPVHNYEGPGYKWILNAKDPAKAARDGEGRPDGMICCELM